MNAHKLIAIALTALLVFAGGAAALPGQASDAADDNQPDDPGTDAPEQANENATDDDVTETDDNETETEDNRTDTDDARDENASDGPPTAMPEQAPDHVTEIHDLVRSKLDGALTGQELGTAISDLMGSDADAETDDTASQSEDASDASEDARSNADNAGPPADLPSQAADHVGAIHDAITSWLNGNTGGNPGDDVSSTAG